jgi:hypothetical protein
LTTSGPTTPCATWFGSSSVSIPSDERSSQYSRSVSYHPPRNHSGFRSRGRRGHKGRVAIGEITLVDLWAVVEDAPCPLVVSRYCACFRGVAAEVSKIIGSGKDGGLSIEPTIVARTVSAPC